MNLNYFQDQFDMVIECKDLEVKKKQLELLANNMEQTYNIPADNNEKYAQSNPYVMKLYKKVKGEIWINKKFNTLTQDGYTEKTINFST